MFGRHSTDFQYSTSLLLEDVQHLLVNDCRIDALLRRATAWRSTNGMVAMIRDNASADGKHSRGPTHLANNDICDQKLKVLDDTFPFARFTKGRMLKICWSLHDRFLLWIQLNMTCMYPAYAVRCLLTFSYEHLFINLWKTMMVEGCRFCSRKWNVSRMTGYPNATTPPLVLRSD